METLITRTLTTGTLTCAAVAIAAGTSHADTQTHDQLTAPVDGAINTLGHATTTVGEIVPIG